MRSGRALTLFSGIMLRNRFLKATKELARQHAAFQEFCEAQEEEVPRWKRAVDDFENGDAALNPYELPQSGE